MILTNKTKGILSGILMWTLLFLAAGVVMSIIGEKMIGITLIFIGPVLSLPIAYFYMRTTPYDNALKESLYLGISWVLVSFLLDLSIMAFLFNAGLLYFTAWTLWIGYGEMVSFTLLLGYLFKRKEGTKYKI